VERVGTVPTSRNSGGPSTSNKEGTYANRGALSLAYGNRIAVRRIISIIT
jgi:hypothetical protein